MLLPESPELQAQRQIDAEFEGQVELRVTEVKYWDQELKRIDPSLELVLATPGAVDLKAGIWHVKKEIPGAVNEFFPLEGPNGEYREPGSWMLDAFQAADLWNPAVHRSKREAKEKLREARVRAKALVAEQRQDELLHTWEVSQRVRGDSGMEKTSQPKRDGEGIRKPESAPKEP